MKIIDGKKISNLIKEEIKKEVDSILARGGKAPHLAAVIAVSYTHLTLPTKLEV